MTTANRVTADHLRHEANKAFAKYAESAARLMQRTVFTVDRPIEPLTDLDSLTVGQVVVGYMRHENAHLNRIGEATPTMWSEARGIDYVALVVKVTSRYVETVPMPIYWQAPVTVAAFLDLKKKAKDPHSPRIRLTPRSRIMRSRMYMAVLGEYDALVADIQKDRQFARVMDKFTKAEQLSNEYELADAREEKEWEAKDRRATEKCDALNEALGVKALTVDWDAQITLNDDTPPLMLLALTDAKRRLGELTPAQAAFIRKIAA